MAYEALYLMLEEELDLKWALAQREQERKEARELAARRWRGRAIFAALGIGWCVGVALVVSVTLWLAPRIAMVWSWL